jgi:hypothetical protein
MTGYADIARHRKRARPLYLELRALGVKLRVVEYPADPREYRIVVGGLTSLPPAHAERLERRILEHEAGLAKVLLGKWEPDLEAVRREGVCR